MILRNVLSKVENSEIAKGFAATTLGSGASKVILVLAAFLFANTLSKNDFGEYSFVRNTLNTILCICALNFTSLCTKFTVESKNSDTSVKRLVILFIFSLVVCLITGSFLLLAPEGWLMSLFSSKTVLATFRITGLLLPLFIIQPLMEGVFRGLMKFKLIGVLQTVSAVFFVAVVYLGIKFDGINGAILGIIIYYTLYSITSIVIAFIIDPIPNLIERARNLYSEKSVLRKMVFPIFIMSFFEAPVLWFAQVLLAKYDSMESVGSMTAIMQIKNLTVILPAYFVGTFLSFASEMSANKQYDIYFRKFKRYGKMFLVIGCVLFLLLSILSKPVLSLYGNAYVDDWPAMLVSNLGIPVIMLISLYRIDLVVQEHQKSLMKISIIWNMAWLISLYILLEIEMLPLNAFFVSQLIGWIINLALYYFKYKKDERFLMKE